MKTRYRESLEPQIVGANTEIIFFELVKTSRGGGIQIQDTHYNHQNTKHLSQNKKNHSSLAKRW